MSVEEMKRALAYTTVMVMQELGYSTEVQNQVAELILNS